MFKNDNIDTFEVRNFSYFGIVGEDAPGGTDGSKNTDDSKNGDNSKGMSEAEKQTLIEKGISIGFARAAEKAEREKDAAIDAFLKEQGLTKEQISKAKGVIGEQPQIQKVLDYFKVENLSKLSEKLEEDARKGMSEIELAKSNATRAAQREADIKAELDATRNTFATKETAAKEREQKLLEIIRKKTVESTLESQAVEFKAFEPKEVVARLQSAVRLDEVENDFVPVVVNDKGEKRYNAEGKPLTITEFVHEYLSTRPHLVKSPLKSGQGTTAPAENKVGGEPSNSPFTKEQLRDKEFFQKNYAAIMAAVKEGKLRI